MCTYADEDEAVFETFSAYLPRSMSMPIRGEVAIRSGKHDGPEDSALRLQPEAAVPLPRSRPDNRARPRKWAARAQCGAPLCFEGSFEGKPNGTAILRQI